MKFSLVNIWYSGYRVFRMPGMNQSDIRSATARGSERELPTKEVVLFLALLVVPFVLYLIPVLASL